MIRRALLLMGLLLSLATSSCFMPYPTQAAGSCQSCYAGAPLGTEHVLLLENIGYSVGYSDSLKNPLWVAYRLFAVSDPVAHVRPSSFAVDPRTAARVSHDDYTHSGYDRGHMAPNASIDYCYGPIAQRETFLMSNVSPQTPTLNRGIWATLEGLVRDWAEAFEQVWVVTGPIFCADEARLPSGVPIPCEFYKIIIAEADGVPMMRAFIIRQDVETGSKPESFLVSVDDIEERTDFDFFWQLSHTLETALEAEIPSDLWSVTITAASSPPPPPAPARNGVDVNTASYVELQRIIHIGPDRADQILSLRAQRPFCCLDDLARISGIASARISDIKAQGLAYVDPETSGQSYPCRHGWSGD